MTVQKGCCDHGTSDISSGSTPASQAQGALWLTSTHFKKRALNRPWVSPNRGNGLFAFGSRWKPSNLADPSAKAFRVCGLNGRKPCKETKGRRSRTHFCPTNLRSFYPGFDCPDLWKECRLHIRQPLFINMGVFPCESCLNPH